MRQILQSLKNGRTSVEDVPTPQVREGGVLVRSSVSLVSAGTERMLVEFGKANMLNKARQQPEKVNQVLQKLRTDGLKPTLDQVLSKLNQPLPLGYCNVGVVEATGGGVPELSKGDRVVSNGKHADIVSVPRNLCAKIPEGVTDEEAVFTVVAAIALQGIRLSQPTLGETVVVSGLGLIGLLSVQLLKANGCRVIGIDYDQDKLRLAESFGAIVCDLSKDSDPTQFARTHTGNRGADAVIIAASSRSSDPVRHAAQMCRKRGRIVLVGVTGLELNRADFYEKELTFQVSCSYGPGRYDPTYEDRGIDYPIGFVRWTEQRNFEAVLELMASGSLDVKPLITHRFNIDQATEAYGLLDSPEYSLGIIISYEGSATDRFGGRLAFNSDPKLMRERPSPVISFIGSGNYATSVLIPAFRNTPARFSSVSCRDGVSGFHVGKKFGFDSVTTDSMAIIEDSATDAIVVSTRHDSHFQYVREALLRGKHVFVEKPLCIKEQELLELEDIWQSLAKKPILMVGFNRRFAPQVQKVKELLSGKEGPKSLAMTVNAGAVPGEHWVHDSDEGGGRLIGEACHFIDLFRYLIDAPIKELGRVKMQASTDDTFSIVLAFEDGSIGAINYFANGPKSLPKERLEVFGQGGVLQLDNFTKLSGKGWPGFKKMTLMSQNKGQRECASAFVRAVELGGHPPIPTGEVFEVARASICLARM